MRKFGLSQQWRLILVGAIAFSLMLFFLLDNSVVFGNSFNLGKIYDIYLKSLK
jgi:hypothetical protein